MSSDLLHRRPDGFLAGFQVQMSQLLQAAKDPFYGTLDFFVDLLPNCLNNVFFNASSSFSS